MFKILFMVLLAIAIILGIVIIITLLSDRKRSLNKKDAENNEEESPANASTDIEENICNIDENQESQPLNTQETSNIIAQEQEVDESLTAVEEVETVDGDDEEFGELKMIVENGETRYIVIKYSKSFKAKLIQSDDKNKEYYSELKNWLLSFDGVKSRISWKWEAFRCGRKTLAKLRMRRKTLSIVLALDPSQFEETKYHVESIEDIALYVDTPCLYHIKNDRRLKYAKELITRLMQENGIKQKEELQPIDYAPQFPYETTDALSAKKLIKVLTDEDESRGTQFKPRQSVSAQEVDKILQDEIAVALIERGEGITDKTKTGILNIDTLSQNFQDGETVTLSEIKKRVKGFSSKVTYIKVLARGTLDKRLTVEADDFSLQAVKMIVLTGGKAVKV